MTDYYQYRHFFKSYHCYPQEKLLMECLYTPPPPCVCLMHPYERSFVPVIAIFIPRYQGVGLSLFLLVLNHYNRLYLHEESVKGRSGR